MIKVENIETFGWEGALRGMRMPMKSFDKSDSFQCEGYSCMLDKCPYYVEGKTKECEHYCEFIIGPSDLNLMKRLCKAGSEHRKYLRMIHVQMDITAGHTFFAELDTYKVATVRNSSSKMHIIHIKKFERDDFDHEGIDQCGYEAIDVFERVIEELEHLRVMFNATKDKKYWRAMIELLPMGYHLTATMDMNYETALNIIKQRTGHKMDEWNELIDVFKRELPYINELLEVL